MDEELFQMNKRNGNHPTSLALPLLETKPVQPDFAKGPRHLGAVKLLRISITDRCNFRCVYCMPDEGIHFSPSQDVLSVGEIVEVARAAAGIGITHLKITGGEPTVRQDLPSIVEGLAALKPRDLSLMTNGMRLDTLAGPLKRAGLDRLTISWDSMEPQHFSQIARGAARDGQSAIAQLKRGINAATDAGFERLKFNVVVIGGINDDEVVDFARLTLAQPYTVRFIEYMPLGDSTLINASGDLGENGSPFTVKNEFIQDRIEQEFGLLRPVDRRSEVGVGPAQVFSLPGAKGRIGFISAMSKPFCENCNRLRLTATGELRSCLFEGGEVNVLPVLRSRNSIGRQAKIVDCMRRCVALRPNTHSIRGNRAMSQVGG